MVSYDDMSDRKRLKHGTRRVQRYLINTSLKVLGRPSWIRRLHKDPSISPSNMRIPVFSQCAEIISNSDEEVKLLPNHVLHYLDDAIRLRDAEIRKWEPLVQYNQRVMKNRNKHIAFNNVFKDVRRMFKLALSRHHANHRKQVPHISDSAKYTSVTLEKTILEFADSENEDRVPDTNNGDKIETSLNLEADDMKITEQDIDSESIELVLSYNSLLLGIQEDVIDSWKDYKLNRLSAAASGIITGFAYQIIQTQISRIEVTERVPIVEFPNCPDTGIVGMLYLLDRSFHEQTYENGPTTTTRESAFREVSRTLFMPTIAGYLSMFADTSKDFKRYMTTTTGMPLFPETDMASGVQDSRDTSDAYAFMQYDWLVSSSLCISKIYKTMGVLQDLVQKPCYSVADALTKALPTTFQKRKKEPVFWEAVALDLLLRTLVCLNESNTLISQGQAAINISHSAQAQGKQLLSARKIVIPAQFHAAADLADKLIIGDPLLDVSRRFKHESPSQFMLHNNPALNGFISQAVLSSLDQGVGTMEGKEPIATAIAIFYKALTDLGYLATPWPEMELLIEFFGIGSILQTERVPSDFQEFYVRSEMVLQKGVTRDFLQPTEFQKLLHQYLMDCSTDNFRGMLKFLTNYLRNQRKEAPDASSEDTTDGEDTPSSPPTTPIRENSDSRANKQDEPLLDDHNFGPREILQAFVQCVEDQDTVSHIAKSSFWLECELFTKYIKTVYVDCTQSEPIHDAASNYRYIPLFLEFLYRNSTKRDVILRDLGVIETFETHIKDYGGMHLKKVEEITGVASLKNIDHK